jgi:hypothetical protein
LADRKSASSKYNAEQLWDFLGDDLLNLKTLEDKERVKNKILTSDTLKDTVKKSFISTLNAYLKTPALNLYEHTDRDLTIRLNEEY